MSWSRWLVGLGVAAGTLSLLWWAFSGKTLESVAYDAHFDRVSQQKVQALVAPFLGQSFWEADLPRLHAQLQQLEWVKAAQVTRRWPDQLQVRLEEQTPVARWGEAALLNQSGAIFYPQSIEGFAHYVRLDGPAVKAKAVLMRYTQLKAQLQAMPWQLIGLSRLVDGGWRLQLDTGQQILLPSQPWAQRLKRFVRSYPSLKSPLRKAAKVFDLRYSNGFVVRKITVQSEGVH